MGRRSGVHCRDFHRSQPPEQSSVTPQLLHNGHNAGSVVRCRRLFPSNINTHSTYPDAHRGSPQAEHTTILHKKRIQKAHRTTRFFSLDQAAQYLRTHIQCTRVSFPPYASIYSPSPAVPYQYLHLHDDACTIQQLLSHPRCRPAPLPLPLPPPGAHLYVDEPASEVERGRPRLPVVCGRHRPRYPQSSPTDCLVLGRAGGRNTGKAGVVVLGRRRKDPSRASDVPRFIDRKLRGW